MTYENRFVSLAATVAVSFAGAAFAAGADTAKPAEPAASGRVVASLSDPTLRDLVTQVLERSPRIAAAEARARAARRRAPQEKALPDPMLGATAYLSSPETRVGPQTFTGTISQKPGGHPGAYSERVMGGNYFDFRIDREAAARYGLTVGDVQDVIQSAIGGMDVSWTVEGLERYPINVRYPRELRDNVGRLKETLVATPSGLQVPLGQLASLDIHQGPPTIKSENARPSAWVFVDLRGIGVGTWVEKARIDVAKRVKLPAGYSIFWSGQYEYMQRAKQRLLLIVPITLFLVFLILYLNTRSLTKTAIVLLAVPFSLVGAIWLMYALGYNWSIAVWVGLIALAGLDAETGVVMLLYLDIAHDAWVEKGKMATYADLAEAVDHGAVQRIRPKMMTVMAILFSLVPILWASGTGADVMRRIAAPMVGGVLTSFVGELVVYPSLYFVWRSLRLRRTPLFPEVSARELRG
jgi:Cu(I)/Ag(I) efflux system membrane protein CusA/SilA